MKKIKISAVSYTNTKPFIYGLKHSTILENVELSLDNPSDCAQKLIDGRADIGLVPVAALPDIPNCNIISDYCIGASQAVNSVYIFSNIPIEQVQVLKLDSQSRTSNHLAMVLLKNYWKVSPRFISAENIFAEQDACVLIGDRTFGKKEMYLYTYDLAEEWIKFTSLPFVFAVWVANKPIPKDFLIEFNAALKLGLDNRNRVIAKLDHRHDFDLEDYLMNRIDYMFDAKKQNALNKFLQLVKEL